MELLVAGALIVAFDQATKRVVLGFLEEGHSVAVGSIVRVRLVTNRRGVLGYAISTRALVVLWGTTIVGLLVLIQHSPFFPGTVARVALGCAVGGATSNLVDRLWRGGVVDFIDLGFWPVFNLADGAIVGGVMLALSLLR